MKWLALLALLAACGDGIGDFKTDANLIIDDVYGKLDSQNERLLAVETAMREHRLCLIHVGCTPAGAQ